MQKIQKNQAAVWELAIWERLLVIFSAISTALMVFIVLFFSRYGFDFTDESFYIYWISDPNAYQINIPVSLFGFIYHPLFMFLNGDITAIRQANVLATFSLCGVLCYVVLNDFWFREKSNKWSLVLISFSMSALSLISFDSWLLTPSYNSLAFQAITLTLLGVLFLGRDEVTYRNLSWLSIGIGGWLTFMAKPSTAAALALIVLGYGAVFGKKYLASIFLAGVLACVLLIFSAVAIDGSIEAFLLRLKNSVEMLTLLGSGQDFSKIFRIDRFSLQDREYFLIAGTVLFVIFSVDAFIQNSFRKRLASFFLCFLLGCTAIFITFSGVAVFDIRRTWFFVTAIFLVAAFALRYSKVYFGGLSRRHLAVGFLLLIIPHVYSFGTNGNYWLNGANAAFFWVLAALVMLSPLTKVERGHLMLIPLVFVFQLMTSAVIAHAIDKPYRQPHTLRENAAFFELQGSSKLILSNGFQDYLFEALNAARQTGFSAGMAMIDLTGQSPGILYALGARSLGQPWMVGAYPGSDKLATATLDQENCNAIASAWLLEEPKGPRSLSVEAILQEFGADRHTDYEVVGSFMTAAYAGGYPKKREQHILKPKRPPKEAVQACINARDGNR